MTRDDKEVTVEVTPEDMEFWGRARAAGLPDIVIAMCGTALRRLVADEREACAKVCEELEAYKGHACAYAIRARSKE